MSTQSATRSLPAPVLTIGEDTVTLVGATFAYVSSKSQPGMSHAVTEHRCSCKSFHYRNHCRHLDAMRAARQLVAAEAETIETIIIPFPTPAPGCEAIVIPDPFDPTRWAVEWAGQIHGGAHFSHEDAVIHAEGLNALPSWAKREWIEGRR